MTFLQDCIGAFAIAVTLVLGLYGVAALEAEPQVIVQ